MGFRVHRRPRPSVGIHREWLPTWLPPSGPADCQDPMNGTRAFSLSRTLYDTHDVSTSSAHPTTLMTFKTRWRRLRSRLTR
jgi:hypothetical protein